MSMRSALITAGVILSAIALFFLYFLTQLGTSIIPEPTFRNIEIVSSTQKPKLYIQIMNWGVNGDHQRTLLSTELKEKFEPDTTKEFVFEGLSPFVYSPCNDTLFLYVWREVPVPSKFQSSWKIIQKEVDNPEMIDLRRAPGHHHL